MRWVWINDIEPNEEVFVNLATVQMWTTPDWTAGAKQGRVKFCGVDGKSREFTISEMDAQRLENATMDYCAHESRQAEQLPTERWAVSA